MASTLRDMSLTCARVSCGVAAAASVQFNAELAQVVIIDLSDRTIGIPLCHDHTRTRTPPMGWTLIDSRTGVRQGVMLDTPTTDGTPSSSTDGPGDRPPLRRPLDRGFAWERAGDDPASRDRAIPPAPIAHDRVARSSDESPAAEVGNDDASPDRDQADMPTSPLLARAFRNAHSDHVD